MHKSIYLLTLGIKLMFFVLITKEAHISSDAYVISSVTFSFYHYLEDHWPQVSQLVFLSSITEQYQPPHLATDHKILVDVLLTLSIPETIILNVEICFVGYTIDINIDSIF